MRRGLATWVGMERSHCLVFSPYSQLYLVIDSLLFTYFQTYGVRIYCATYRVGTIDVHRLYPGGTWELP